jgi:tetratricopeptide (TPR) repeat protein
MTLTRSLAIALLVVAALPSAARAADEIPPERIEEAKEFYEDATIAYDDGRYDQALRLFERAYVRAPLPGFLFNIGQCHRQLGNSAQAIDFFERYLEQVPEAPNRADVEGYLDTLKASPAADQPPPKTERDVGEVWGDVPPPAATTEPAPPEDGPIDPMVWVITGVGVGAVALTAAAVVGTVLAVNALNAPSLGRKDLRGSS